MQNTKEYIPKNITHQKHVIYQKIKYTKEYYIPKEIVYQII